MSALAVQNQERVRTRRAAPRSRPLSSEPWAARDATGPALLVGLGGVGMIACYIGVHDRGWNAQMGWVAGAALGTAVAVMGMVGWLLIGLRVVRVERREVLAILTCGLVEPQARAGVESADALRVSGPRMVHFHRQGCPLTRLKAVEAVTADRAEAKGLIACGVCQA